MMHEEILKQGLKIGTSNTLLHIDNPNVLNGAKCDCECPYCHAPLVARKEGKGGRYRQNIHHFAHAKGYEPCGKGGTSALHILAQEVLKDECQVMLPAYKGKFVQHDAKLQVFDEVTLEEVCKDEVSRRRPDCTGKVESEGIDIWVEIYCTNPINEERKADIVRRKQYCIEIDFSDLLGTDYTKESVRERLLNKSDDRVWICHPVWDKEEADKEEEERQRKEEEERRRKEAERKALEERERVIEERKRALEEALKKGTFKSIQQEKHEIQVPQFTGNVSEPKETWHISEPKKDHSPSVTETPDTRDWLMWIKSLWLRPNDRIGFYEVMAQNYYKVTFANSHRFVVIEARLKSNELLGVVNTNPKVLQPETLVYLEFLLVIWILSHLNKCSAHELGKTFVENQEIRNTVLKAIKQIGSVNAVEEQRLRGLSIIQEIPDKETAIQILRISCSND